MVNKGNKYQYDTILALFTSMDMSSNNLSGDIPISLTRLAGLRSFNFSKNNLTGRIPNDIGYMKVLESVDLSENQLYGQIPQSISSLTTLSYLNLSDNNLSDDESYKDEVDWFYTSMAIGFALSFWGFYGSLFFKRSWRHAYFRFLDRCWEMLLSKFPIY
ncbi:hypothetical protein H5410_000983 [Solanum commersonii]|uniref:Uncharacterized protein n=1 Tax=Solanum commersonii TaxID=4109 RepID=A0A9J6AYB0_SOLCO|nr:hypothetical protein H5410_000983 [Solanum commersonii]